MNARIQADTAANSTFANRKKVEIDAEEITEMNEPSPPDFDLSCWYLNQRRVMSLTGAEPLVGRFGGSDEAAAHMRRLATNVGFERAMGEWLE